MPSWSCKTLQKWVLCSNKKLLSVAECCGSLTSLFNLCREFGWRQNHSIQMGRSERSSKWQEQNDELRSRLSCTSAQVSCSWNLHIQVGLLVDLCNYSPVFVLVFFFFLSLSVNYVTSYIVICSFIWDYFCMQHKLSPKRVSDDIGDMATQSAVTQTIYPSSPMTPKSD